MIFKSKNDSMIVVLRFLYVYWLLKERLSL